MHREQHAEIQDMLSQRDNIVKALQYHQNETSKLRKRLREMEGLLDGWNVKRSVLPGSLIWMVKD